MNNFYAHPSTKDGYLNKCKDCNKKDSRRNYRRKVQNPQWVIKERARHREKFNRLHKNWHLDKEAAHAARQRWISRNRHKRYAHIMLGNAVRDGRIIKPTCCQRCGIKPTSRHLHGHHHDYSKPLDVEWICTTCHGIDQRIPS